jgi:hypothetical protein
VDQLIQGLKTTENKPKKKNNEEAELQVYPADGAEGEDLIFKGGKEFIYEDDSYLQFNPEESELKNNPAFGYLGMIFDKEGTRGLITNDLDIGEEKLQKLDIFKYNREMDMEGFKFLNSQGSIRLFEDTQDFLEDLNTLNDKSRKARLLPQLTKFCTEHSEDCRKDFTKFMIYSAKEFQKYRDGRDSDPSKERFFDIIGGLNYEQDQDVQVPDMSQFTQAFGNRRRTSLYDQMEQMEFDQPIGRLNSENGFGTQSGGDARPLMQEINDVLRNAPPVIDDFDMRSNTAMHQLNEYHDYGGIESLKSRNPEDYLTPNLENVLERAAKKLASVEQSMKSYNMRTELRRQETHFKTAYEIFGPSNISANKEKLAKVKRIIGPRDGGDLSQSAQPRRVRAVASVDFTIDPLQHPPNAGAIIDQMLALENNRTQKKSKQKNFLQEEFSPNLHAQVLAIEQKFQLPPEIEISGSTFNSLFTRDLQEFDLKAQMNELLERDRKEEARLLRDVNADRMQEEHYSSPKAFHDEDPALADPSSQVFGGMNLEEPEYIFEYAADAQNFQDGQIRPPIFEVQGDLVGMNLLKNYMNFQQEEAISNLEKKLSQTYNFKISTFKSHVQNKYLSVLAPQSIERAEQEGTVPNWIETTTAKDGSIRKGVRFSRVSKELISFWKRNHDVEVTLQACFLTILHLCTENSLYLYKMDHQENDFFISSTSQTHSEHRNLSSRIQNDFSQARSQVQA